ncbi:ABC transporter ATP-binding protein [Streptomyces marincola]|uniref:ABC transporter ATP-binding protein n=1 Tax=Streptomyces marincola TaxID=2878388 RepID=UPI001CF4F477|nr:ABC transporter ATP-binding protein [Streptomyces marincola]UCM88140.1 ABC transporter ATP-binding protein/permease [Streptomyces marincola]
MPTASPAQPAPPTRAAPSGDRLLARLLRGTRALTALYLVAAAASAATALLLPAALAAAVNAAVGRTSATTPVVLTVLLLAIAALAEVAAELAQVRTSTRGAAWLRHDLLRHMVRLDLRGQRRFPAGDVLSRLLQSTSQTANLVPTVVGGLMSGLVSVGAIAALFLIDPGSGLIFLLGAPVVWLVAKGFFHRTTALTEGYQRAHGELAGRFLEAVRGIRTIRAAGTADRETERVLEPLPRLRLHGERFWLAQRDAGWRISLVVPVLQIGVLATAGHGVASGRLAPGDLLAVTGYLGQAFGVFAQIGVIASLGQVRGSANRIREVLAAPPAPSGSRAFPPGGGALRLSGVRVLADGKPLLDGVDAELPAGSEVAVVGESGTGKSTLAALAGGLLHPDAGTVTLDGVDLAAADPAALRREIACAFERPVLLGATVRDAIGYGDEPVDGTALARGLRDSGAREFVSKLPRQLDTPLGDLRASGGEYQRLGLARAFCRNARLLVLDDATSSVDVITERRIARALRNHPATRLVVTHRVSTAARADLVLWLHEGSVAAVGPHSELLALPGYAALFGEAVGSAGQARETTGARP